MKIKQKIIGVILAILGILSVLPEHDGTAALLLVPLGVYIFFTHKEVVD